jgi:LacI family transcriptional regulator
LATIYDVAERAGVSLATVSRVFNHADNVSEKTRNKVLAAIRELNYRPKFSARSLATNRSQSIGVLVPELYGPFFGTMLSGIEAELRAAGKHVIIAVGHSNEQDERSGIEHLLQSDCDALILHVDATSDDDLIELSSDATSVVVVNRSVAEIADHCISLNNETGGYVATQCLIDLGHRDIAYISGPLWKHDVEDRLAGHKRALAEAGIEFSPYLIFEGDFQELGGINGMRHFLQSGATFSAVVCANDEMAAAAMGVAQDNGLAVPKQVSIVGFDDVNFSRYVMPKLTTVHYPMDSMGRMAARLVLNTVYGKQELEVQKVFAPRLIMRASVAPPFKEPS